MENDTAGKAQVFVKKKKNTFVVHIFIFVNSLLRNHIQFTKLKHANMQVRVESLKIPYICAYAHN